MYSSVNSSFFKLENAPRIAIERKDEPSASLTYEDQPQSQLKVNINMSYENYFNYLECMPDGFIKIKIFLSFLIICISFFNRKGQSAH